MKRLKNIQKAVSKQKNQQRKKEKNVETIDDLKLLLLEYQRKLFQSNYTSLRL